MKKGFIAKGETVEYDNLYVNNLTVNGCLKVKGRLTAEHIQGSGFVEAEEIECGTLKLHSVRAQILTARMIAAKKLFVRDCTASSSILCTDFAESLSIRAPEITVGMHSFNECRTDNLIVLPAKRRGFLRMLFASWLRGIGGCSLKETQETPAPEPEAEAAEQAEVLDADAVDPHMVEDIAGILRNYGYLGSGLPGRNCIAPEEAA